MSREPPAKRAEPREKKGSFEPVNRRKEVGGTPFFIL